VHGDIKSGNILYNLEGEVKIIDFGLSTQRIIGEDQTKNYRGGTPAYFPPEIFNLSHLLEAEQYIPARESADIWAFGIFALELATGKLP
jgi:serine/threonine protein kinase